MYLLCNFQSFKVFVTKFSMNRKKLQIKAKGDKAKCEAKDGPKQKYGCISFVYRL